MPVAEELVRYELGLMGARGVKWDKGRNVRAGYCIFYGKENHRLGREFLVHHRIVSAVREKSLSVIECHI
jgi:hypothetical protein